MNHVQLIIGGARSGKSALAQSYAQASNLEVIYIATAHAFDQEMQTRIRMHQADRPAHWQLVESPFCLANNIEKAIENFNVTQGHCKQGVCILVDCLTLWLSNCLCREFNEEQAREPRQQGEALLLNPGHALGQEHQLSLDYWAKEKQQLLSLLESIQEANSSQQINLILVSNEVGHGIVPMGELSRQFVDQAGWLHQAIGRIASNVDFVMAGLPLTLKG